MRPMKHKGCYGEKHVSAKASGQFTSVGMGTSGGEARRVDSRVRGFRGETRDSFKAEDRFSRTIKRMQDDFGGEIQEVWRSGAIVLEIIDSLVL